MRDSHLLTDARASFNRSTFRGVHINAGMRLHLEAWWSGDPEMNARALTFGVPAKVKVSA